jgi:pimeloyl-ACP methyl ester carboxylesterase
MGRKHWWMAGMIAGIGTLGAALTTGLVALAAFFVDELSRPHAAFEASEMQDVLAGGWAVPTVGADLPSDVQRPLIFRAPGGPTLRGDFWPQRTSAPTVIICHGYRVSRAHLRSVAALEYQRGYNVLCFDFRGHGESEGAMTSGGLAEVRDLHAAITLAAQQPETLPGQIILHGFSMGAAVALMALPHPQVAAVIADSPYARLDDILRRLVRWRLTTDSAHHAALRHLRRTFSGVAWATVAASAVLFRLRFHQGLLARPAAGLRGWLPRGHTLPATPILLIHTTGDPMIPIAHAHHIAATAQHYHIPIETYFPDDSNHCGAYGHDPAAYVRLWEDFIARHVASSRRSTGTLPPGPLPIADGEGGDKLAS